MPDVISGPQTLPFPAFGSKHRTTNPHLHLRRLQTVIGLVLLGFFFLLARLTVLHLFQHDKWLTVASKQHDRSLTLTQERGMILDRQGKPLATSKLVPSIYGVPHEIKEIGKTAATLVSILGGDKRVYEEALSKEKSFVWIKRMIDDEAAEKLKKEKIPGIGLRYESKRFYPQGAFLAPILGFCNIDEQGLEGIELKFNHELSGRSGYRRTRRDALGREIALYDEQLIPPVNGHHVYLTIDRFIQFHTEEALKRGMEKWKAKGGMAVVMDPWTGEVLAMASLPSFDPNQYQDVAIDLRRNRAVTDYFEPGSTFKFITAAAALESKSFTFDTKIDCENGAYTIGRHTLHDVKKNGLLSFPEVFIKSSNIGTVKIAQKLGDKTIYEKTKAFGFGEPTGIDLPGEVPGMLRPLSGWSKLSISAIPIGHEVGVTALQMARALSAVANGGKIMKPYAVKEVRDETDALIHANKPEVIRTVMDPEIARQVTEILTRVTTEGTGKSAKIEGVSVAGKTGTAQKLTPDGKTYSHDSYVSSFIGFAPADKPRYVMIAVLDEPKGQYYGGTVAAPIFREVMEEILLQDGLITQKKPTTPTAKK